MNNERIDSVGEKGRRVFLATDLADYDIPWGDDAEWEQRGANIAPEAGEALKSLGLYWKYAWHTARSPYLTMQLVDATAPSVTDKLSDRLWESMIDIGEFQLSLLGSQVLAYSAFYFGYEHFLTECCAIRLTKAASDLMGYGTIRHAVIDAFGTETENSVWSETRIEIARRARNALVHNGGLPDQRLKEMAPDLLVDGHISIHPVDVAALFQTLKEKVDVILGNW